MKKYWVFIVAVVLVSVGLALHFLHGNMFSAGTHAFNYFAMGDYSIGIFSMGQFSIGVFSMGLFSMGIFSISIFNICLYGAGIFILSKRSIKYRLEREKQ